MKDFSFDKKIYELRKTEGFSQSKLASLLGVTNKAVSKWENGNALPSLEQLAKLSQIFNVSIDELVNYNKPNKDKKIYKIVITGGPCSGKSTALSWLQNEFSKKGYLVLFVPETATEMIIGGIAPWTIDNNIDFETSILKLQIQKEKIFEEAIKNTDYDKVLIVCDRGCLDCKAYMTQNEFNRALKILDTTEIQLRDSYDAVFHLVTAAKGAEEFYNFDNEARLEMPNEAIKKDDDTLNAWIGHPHIRVIDNSTDFETKMHRLMNEISNFLGTPDPFEIERKFLIEYPNLETLEKMPNCQKVDIIQTYLKSVNSNEETRIRQRGNNGSYIYTKTTKRKINDIKRIETESRITKDEYLKLLLDIDTDKRQIRKTRYCLMYENQYFEIDIYPFWKDKAIMEIELHDEKQEIKLPSFIKVIKDVTGESEYLNSHIASSIS
ncbi:MAG: AAA family ATPase [Clostridia bacterium]|nr:AAA family ATPase [Clostridia bacterium]